MGKKIARLITTRPIEMPGGTIRFTEESFQGVLDTINGSRAVRQGVNHDPTYPPSGKNTSAWTVAEDGFTSLYVEVDDTHVVKRTKFQRLTGRISLRLRSRMTIGRSCWKARQMTPD